MSALREIFVKAVCARGKRGFARTHRFRTKYHPDDLLGCRVTNHRYGAVLTGSGVTLQGSYDIHVWYAYSGVGDGADGSRGKVHTGVSVQTVEFQEHLPVQYLTGGPGAVINPECRVAATRQPRAREIALDADGVVQVTVEDGYAAEVIGETTLWVPVYGGVGTGGDEKKALELWESMDSELDDEFDDDLDDDEFEVTNGEELEEQNVSH
ncbi:MAG: outer spore coat protein CotE [Firmicutes bacterium]|nr:outer spore coat protein CotE [Bacillota bacterium]